MTPRRLTKIVRCLLWPIAFLAGMIALGAGDRWVERLEGGPLVLKAISFYVTTLVLYAAFPRHRRFDLTLVALLWVVTLDLSVGILGAPRAPGWLALDGAAVLCAYLPGRIEGLRGLLRRSPDKPFAEIAQADRRRSRRRREDSLEPATA